jgi:hypothetical protein
MLHACNPSTQEAEARGSTVQGQPGLHSETLPQKKLKQCCLEKNKRMSSSVNAQITLYTNNIAELE